jgi:hypothetical protein
MKRAFPDDEGSGADSDVQPLLQSLNLPDNLVELMRRRYREAHSGEDAPDDQTLLEYSMSMAILTSLTNPEIDALLRADARRSPEERQIVYDYIDRCVAEAVANAREVETGIEGPLTPEAIEAAARKITEN